MQMHKGMTNLEIAKLLRSIGAALQVKPQNQITRFRIIAYNNAADAIEHATSEVKDLWDDGQLDQIPGVGKGIGRDIDELFKTGSVKPYEEIMEGLPPAMFELMEVTGIGAKRAFRLSQELGITKAHGALEKLKHAAEKGRIAQMEGFGEQSEREILAAVSDVKERNRRLLLPHATIISEEVIEWMKKCPQVEKIETLGSLRRRVATVGDIDIAVASGDGEKVIKHFTEFPKKVKLIEAGPFSSSLLLAGGVQVDLMVQPNEYFGALLQHFTGSKPHNIALRTFALKKGLSLSERGIKLVSPVVGRGIKTRVAGGKQKMDYYATEKEFYRALGMDWIPPEMREDKGEIELSLAGKLPKLVELKDIKGDLHMHSDYPKETSHDCGAHSMEVMVEAGINLGYEYMGFSEHNLKSSSSETKVLEIMKRKREMTHKLNDKIQNPNVKFRIFNGLEIDIKPDGEIAFPEAGFEHLDYAIVSLHSSFSGKTREEQTKRVLEGLSHPKVRIFGHPTGRKLNEREGIDLNWDKIFDFALKNNKWIEINSSPDRLDLPDSLVFNAVKLGVKLIINTDSHDVSWLPGMRYGVDVARRGWCEKKDVINTLNLSEFEKEI